MITIGLTGGIASGKSTVSAELRQQGVPIFDADQNARDAVAKGSKGLAMVVEAFGSEYLTDTGELNRPKVSELVFHDKAALKTWLSNITYPISFLDFEWERFAVPPYEGMKPYDVLPFEYALYILHEDGTMEHRIYLNVHDDRRNMAENLVRDIPKTGSVVAYNATGAESVRIREFAELYEDLADDLYAINARMEDLQIPFCTGTVYDVRMRGQWSLKVIMSMMNDASYTDLDINQGMEAVYQWRHLDYDDETPAQEKEKIIEDLKKYCGMDAYAMTVVYRWLVSISD